MKNKFILIAIAILTPVLIFNFYYPASENQIPPSPQQNNFILGAMNNRLDVNYTNIANPDVFGMNLWHQYSGHDTMDGRSYPHGWTLNDSLFAVKSSYEQGITDKINENASNNMKTLMERPKVMWLAYGQRSDYQCENDVADSNLWFYAFNSDNPQHNYVGSDWVDNTSYGNNAKVKKCLTEESGGDNTPGWVVDRLMANNEQANVSPTGVSGFNPRDDSQWRWYIKPKIRIDSTVAHSSSNPLVCNIKVISPKPILNNG